MNNVNHLGPEEFHRRAGEEWASAIQSLGIDHQASTTWSNVLSIEEALRPFVGKARNHAHFPTGGGQDFLSIRASREDRCLEAMTSERGAEVFKPRSLILEHFPYRPQESFLLLDLEPLAPTGVYDRNRGSEELVDVPGRGYLSREVWDRGYLGYDEYERELPIPEDARLVTRWLEGKILLVANGSLWNSTPATYDGRHNHMSATEIRQMIERALARA